VTERYVHPHAELSLTVPAPFVLLEEEVDRAVLALDATGNPTLIVTIEEVFPDTTADELADGGLGALAGELAAFHVLDRAHAGLDGQMGVRTLSHHVADGRGMTLEQWRVAADGQGLTLSGSCQTLDYPIVADLFSAAAERLAREPSS